MQLYTKITIIHLLTCNIFSGDFSLVSMFTPIWYANSQIKKASKNGDILQFKRALRAGANVNVVNKSGRTPLMLASRTGHIDIAKLLIESGAQVNQVSNNGVPALGNAVHNRQLDIGALLLQSGAQVNQVNNGGVPALGLAVGEKQFDIVALLLRSGADVNIVNNYGSALTGAARVGDLNIAKLLIEAGANVNAVNRIGSTPLMLASGTGHIDVARLLIESGAQVNQVNNNGMSALGIAVGEKQFDIVALLLQSGADVNIVNENGSALTVAAIVGDLNIAKLLIESGANVNVVNGHGDTLLMYSMYSEARHIDIVKLFLQAGASVDSVNKLNFTALDFAKYKCQSSDYLEVLQEAQSVHDQINFEIDSEFVKNSEILQKINTLPIESPEFQMILNYILNRIKVEQRKEFFNLERISQARIMLITIADRLASSYAKYVDKVIKDVLGKRLKEVLELPFDVQIEILKYRGLQSMLLDSLTLRLKRKLPFTDFYRPIQLKDGKVITFGLLILEEIIKKLPLN